MLFRSYQKVLFLDVDILINRDLKLLTHNAKKMVKNYIYAYSEPYSSHTEDKWRVRPYTEKELKMFEKMNINPFNTGTLFFIPTPTMKQHFINMQELIQKNRDIIYHYDQSVFNHYFNLKKLSKTKLMDNLVKTYPDSLTEYKDPVLLHFVGIGESEHKIKLMINYYNKFFNQTFGQQHP